MRNKTGNDISEGEICGHISLTASKIQGFCKAELALIISWLKFLYINMFFESQQLEI